jgi:transmembrane sensor
MATRVTNLLEKQIAGTLTRSERWELKGMLLEPALQKDIKTFMEAAWHKVDEDQGIPDAKVESFFRSIVESGTVIEMKPVTKVRWMVAASIIALLGIGSYFLFFNKPVKQDEIVKIQVPIDVKAPATNRAMITLANGAKVYLDSAVDGKLLQLDGVEVVKLEDGKIIYKGSTAEVVYNTLSNPKGSKVIDMTLADGSRVWLNAGSSVKFPVAFVGNERKVEITGEAYFEVAHNAAKPFTLRKGDIEVTVLGTHFNVNAYDDEPVIKVTLLEGSVKVARSGDEALLLPGQQAEVSDDIKVVNDVDLDEVMAWKNGQFYFNGTNLKAIMSQVMRWYDIEVVYEGTQSISLSGVVERNVPLSQILRLLESNGVQYRQEGRRIIMMK